MRHFFYSEVGGHAVNEDVAIFQPHPDEPSLLIGALADGQGGQAGGGQAAQVAVAMCLKGASACTPQQLTLPLTWVDICESADQVVSRDTKAGFTTLIGVAVTHSFVVGASCGDSAVFLWNNARAVILTQAQQKNPPVGSGAACLTAFSALPKAPWKLLVVSDGVWKGVGWETIGTRLGAHSGEALISRLREDVLSGAPRGLPDDFTAVLIES